MDRIPLTRPVLGAAELDEIDQVLQSGMLVQSQRVAALERAMSARLADARVVAVSSGTDAIHLTCRALDLGPGDEVIVPDFCFPSVAAAVIHTGAEVVLCDVDPDTFNLDRTTVEAALSERTRAVIAVDQFGLPCDAAALDAALPCDVIEDAACALGAVSGGEPCGTTTRVGCISLHPRKMITTGEGGLVVTRDAALADRVGWLRTHGMRRGEAGVVFEEIGFSARMSEVHAAIGLAQMARWDAVVNGRMRSAMHYRTALDGARGIAHSDATWRAGRVYQSLVLRLADGVDRDRVVATLRSRGIESTVGTYAIHRQPAFAGRCRTPAGGLPGSVRSAEQSITLPLWPDMPGEDIDRVVGTLRDLVEST